jgi:amidase
MLAENARRTASPESAVAVMRLQALTRRIVAFWSDVDIVVTPTLALPPVAVGWTWDGANGDPQVAFSRQWQWTPFTAIVNVTGQPAMSVPLHWSDDGLPVGVQMIGAPFAEATLVRLAAQLEEARPWAHRRPAGF